MYSVPYLFCFCSLLFDTHTHTPSHTHYTANGIQRHSQLKLHMVSDTHTENLNSWLDSLFCTAHTCTYLIFVGEWVRYYSCVSVYMWNGTVAVPHAWLHTFMHSIQTYIRVRTLPSRHHRRRCRVSIPKIEKCQNSLKNTPKTYGIVSRKKGEKKHIVCS